MIRYFPLLLLLVAYRALSAPETVVVTGQYLPLPTADRFADALVLDTAALDSMRVPEISAALNQIPGLYAQVESGPGGVNAVSLRGGEPNFTVVMIDGVAINDPTNSRGGSADLAAINPLAVDRVEVVRGPQSVIYGADALAGAINIITRRAAVGWRLSGLSESGDFGREQHHLSADWRGERLGVALGAGKLDAGEAQRGSRLRLNSYTFNSDLALGALGELRLKARRADSDKTAYPEQSGGPEFSASSELDRQDARDDSVGLGLSLALAPRFSLDLTARHFLHAGSFQSPGIEPGTDVPPNGYEAIYRRDDAGLLARVLLPRVRWEWGADERRERGHSEGAVDFSGLPPEALLFLLGVPASPPDSGLVLPAELSLDTDYALKRETQGLFTQIALELHPTVGALFAWRKDDVDIDRDFISRRFALDWTPLERLSLRAAYATGFKSPGFFALGHSLVGNPALRAERGLTKEVGVAWASAINVSLTLFDSEYTDLVDFDPEQFTNVNRDQVVVQGGELQLSGGWRAIDWQAHVGWNDIDVRNSDRRLANRPSLLGGVSFGAPLDDVWSWHMRGRYVGSRRASSLHTGESRETMLEAYDRWDAVINAQWRGGLKAYLALDNVFDRHYHQAVGVPGPGRVLRLGVQWSWELTDL